MAVKAPTIPNPVKIVENGYLVSLAALQVFNVMFVIFATPPVNLPANLCHR